MRSHPARSRALFWAKAREALAACLAWSSVYGLAVLAFSLFALAPWAPPATPKPLDPALVGLRGTHLLNHALVGFAAGVPARRLGLALFSAAGAVLIDLDHSLMWAGLPVVGRPNHSLFFVFVVGLVVGAVFGRGRGIDGRVGLVAAASVLAHLAYDSLSPHNAPPLYAPLSFADVGVGGVEFFVYFFSLALVSSALAGGVGSLSRRRAALGGLSTGSLN